MRALVEEIRGTGDNDNAMVLRFIEDTSREWL